MVFGACFSGCGLAQLKQGVAILYIQRFAIPLYMRRGDAVVSALQLTSISG